ncbi:alpha/beta hydrolase [Microbacterium enclense]|uniref:alpha/beta hydrolase n=1 Tax=Microbacterium enclense TaxID=993073 RepID=UPI001F0C87E9|nr:alpha/beta hydrolase [Microbacterium enclense]
MTLDARGTVLVLPGGGYRRHADGEAEPIAAWLRELGWNSRVVRYPVLARHPEPLRHVQHEIAEERARGAATVGVIGFSAGGHLAGLAALTPDAAAVERPDFAILGYAVVSLLATPNPDSATVLLGPDSPRRERAALSLETLVSPQSPPLFIWHTADDPTVPVWHARALAEAMAAVGAPHELWVYPGDVHGVALARDTPAGEWTARAAAWLRARLAEVR